MPWWILHRKPKQHQTVTLAGPGEGQSAATTTPSSSSQGDTLYTRNWAYISPELQDSLAKTTLFTAGAGLGSVAAVLAARTGVQRFIIADGDIVEESNLNRQAFTRMHFGQNKAEATAAIIKDIQPAAHIEVIAHYLDAEDCATLIPRADIILNTIDLDTPAFLEMNRAARAARKSVLFPLNPAWMGTLIVFTPDSQSLDEFLGIEHMASDQVSLEDVTARLLERIYTRVPGNMPTYMRALFTSYFSEETQQNTKQDVGDASSSVLGAPQLGVTSYLTAALTVRTLVALVAHEPVRVAPQVITTDVSSLVRPLP